MNNFLEQISGDIFVTLFVGGLGVLSKFIYDRFNLQWRLRHMSNIFGGIRDIEGEVRFVLPVFHPISDDNFAEGEVSRLKKEVIEDVKGMKLQSLTVPLYSDVLVIDDFKAYRQLEKLFANHRYGFLEFRSDIDSLKDWQKLLILCVGGPRSNQKLRQIINLPTSDFIDVDDSGDQLSDWLLSYKTTTEDGTYRSSDEDAYGYIFKTDNPHLQGGKLIAVAGDSANSTSMAARYLCDNLLTLSKKYGKKNFMIILHADRGNFETLREEKGFVLA